MGGIDTVIIFQIVIFLLFPFIGGYIAHRLKLPMLVGYILSGVAIGSFFGDIISEAFLAQTAGIGIVLLLFTVGLELNIASLRKFGSFIFRGGLLQIIISAFFIALFALGFRLTLVESVIVGLSFSLSSTAIVSRLLAAKGEDNSLMGSLALGLLLFQDLAAIPLIIIASSFATPSSLTDVFKSTGLSFMKASLVLAIIFVFGKRIVPLVFSQVARSSKEILNLFTILFIVVTVGVFSYLGLAPSVAAFIAGLLGGQTLAHYHIFSQIRPLRDIFAVLFFVSLGAQVKIAAVIPIIVPVVIFALLVVFIKTVVLTIIFIRFRFHTRTSLALGLLLSQVGEFAFIILSIGRQTAMISPQTYLFGLASVLVTIAIGPILGERRERIYVKIRTFVKKWFPDLANFLATHVDREPAHIEALDIKDHVIVCGFGRVGKYVGRALEMAKIPYIAIDYNYYTVSEALKHNINIIYGDPTDIDILDYAQAEKAICVIAAVPGELSQEMILLNAKMLNPEVIIFTRVALEGEQQRMKDLGAQVVVQPEFEASLSIIRKVYGTFGVSQEEASGKIRRLKIEHGMT